MYVVSQGQHSIKRINLVSGKIVNSAGICGGASYNGDGPSTNSYLYNPTKLAFDSAGNYYIADLSNNRVRYVDTTQFWMTTTVGLTNNGASGFNGDYLSPADTNVNQPTTVAVDANNVFYFSDLNYRIRGVFSKVPTSTPTLAPSVANSMTLQTVVGNGVSGYPADELLATNTPSGYMYEVVFDQNNNMYYSDNGRVYGVRVVSAATGITNTFAGSPTRTQGYQNGAATSALFNSPNNLNFSPDYSVLYICDHGYHNVRMVTMATLQVTTFAGTTGAGTGGETVASVSSSSATTVTGAGGGGSGGAPGTGGASSSSSTAGGADAGQ